MLQCDTNCSLTISDIVFSSVFLRGVSRQRCQPPVPVTIVMAMKLGSQRNRMSNDDDGEDSESGDVVVVGTDTEQVETK